MSNIRLIIAREYTTRVRRRTFIIMTILTPLLLTGLIYTVTWTATRQVDTKTVQILDESSLFEGVFVDTEEVHYAYVNGDLEGGKADLMQGRHDGLLYIPEIDIDQPQGIVLYAPTNLSIAFIHQLERKIETELEVRKLQKSGIDQAVLDQLKANVDILTINLSEGGAETESSSTLATGIGYTSAMMIYMFIFIYGAQCMRGVIEEKSNRIIEVMIASVRPFQLMMGKVLGIAGVGLTQFVLWIVITLSIGGISGTMLTQQKINDQNELISQLSLDDPAMSTIPHTASDGIMSDINKALQSINVLQVVIAFLFYFLSGYLLYGALFASIGAAVDSDADAQQFMLPVTLPLVGSMVILSAVLNDPNGSLAFWMSIIPFTAPVVMMMRVPFGVPFWELMLSAGFMIAGIILTVWVASRIYRVGILMHGTKVNYKVLAKWFLMKG